MTDLESLCCLLSSQLRLASIPAALLDTSLRWHDKEHAEFWELAAFNGVAVLAAKKCERLGIPVPDAVKSATLSVETCNLQRRAAFLRLAKAFADDGIDVYLLKGFLLGELVYCDPAYKRMNDIDILIKPESVIRTAEIAQQMGYVFATHSMIGANPIDFRLHHSPPLISRDRQTIIGLHWNIASPFSKRRPRSDIFEGAETIVVDSIGMKRLSFENNILHLCMHLPFFKIGLRELADVANLVEHAGSEVDMTSIVEKARVWRCEDALFRVMMLANALIPCLTQDQTRQLEEIEKKAEPSRYYSDTRARLSNRSLLLRSRSVYVGQVEKNYALFKLAYRFSDKLFHLKEQWRLILFVAREERRRLLPEHKWFARSRASWALCFAMMQDLGPWLFVAVTAKNVLSLFKKAKGNRHDFEMAKQILTTME